MFRPMILVVNTYKSSVQNLHNVADIEIEITIVACLSFGA